MGLCMYVCVVNSYNIAIIYIMDVYTSSYYTYIYRYRLQLNWRNLAMDNIEILDECGFGKPITRLKLTDKPDLVQADNSILGKTFYFKCSRVPQKVPKTFCHITAEVKVMC